MRLSQLASSGFQESARQSQVQAETALDGYNHRVTSGWSQLSQISNQTGTSDSLINGSENSLATNATRGASMMLSAAESYAKANNISTQEAYNKLMDISNQGSVSAGVKTTAGGGLNLGVVKVGAEGNISSDLRHSTGSSRGIQNSDTHSQDMRHDQNSQAVNDFRQGMDMVKSNRITDGANHTENAASSNVQQLAATLNDAQSQYHQYTTSSTQSDEFSRMATVAQNQSASLDTNYTQEFVDWAANKYGDKAQSMLTSAPSAREAAMEFVNERLKPEIMRDYQQGRSDLTSGNEHAAFSGEHIVQPAHAGQQVSGLSGNNGAYSSNGVGNVHTSGTTQVAEHGQDREVIPGRSGINIDGEKVRSDAMQETYKENQTKLHEQSGQGFGPQNDIQRRVAEQRSANEHKINESAGEIDKKESTVQASSDILKGEDLNATGKFNIQRKEAEIDQQMPVIDSAEKRKLEEQLLELRKRTG